MYDIKQFRPALYFVLLLGLTGFCFAVEAAGLWVLSVAVVGLHIWLVKTGRFRPLPRILANGVTLAALALAFQILRGYEGGPGTTAIVVIGEFLVFLQLVKLFELRANRDYAQLLILSLLLMVAGAISTPRLSFAIILVVYLFVSLYVCLLFHLKIENDHALSVQQALPRGRLNEATVKQDQRYLPRSMRRLAALVSLAGVGMAVFVFLFFPRAIGAGMFGELQLQPAALTGISNEISFTNITNIAQNNEIVAQVQLYKNDRLVEGTQTLLLRGQTLDEYRSHKWTRSSGLSPAGGDGRFPGQEGDVDGFIAPYGTADSLRAGADVYRAQVALRPTRTRMLFTMPGMIKFVPSRGIGRVRHATEDDTLSTATELTQRLDYEVECLDKFIEPNLVERVVGGVTRTAARTARAVAANVPPRVAEYARRPEVCGVDAQNRPLATLRSVDAAVTDMDKEIATNIEKHLRTTFGYTLDLTGEKRTPGADPNEDFLYVWKKGHCEYFASSMVLMCQSLGIQARLVTGFKCDEYDPSPGHYYVVRQSHAHAWVEVRTAAGWQTFDPTSGNDAGGTHGRSAWQAVKHFFDWLDFKWAEKVVAYDAERRENLISNVDRAVVNTMLNAKMNPNTMSGRLRDWWRGVMDSFDNWLTQGGWMVSAKLILALIVFLVFACLFIIGKFVVQRRRMRKRAVRIGLDALPPAEQIRLARQLGFYERLTTLLERRRIVRLRHQTPGEFGDSLSFLPNEAYDTIRRLTRVFYAVRYGRQELDHDEQRDLESTVDGLAPILDNTVLVR